MQAIKRRRLGRDGWRDLLAQFEDSGLTVSAFCSRVGVSTASFYRWRSLLGMPVVGAQGESLLRTVAASKAAFVDLGSLGAREGASSRFELRLDLGGGLLLSLVRS